MSKFIVTGCAGFIGSNLVDKLLADGHTVIGIDNLVTGQQRFLKDLTPNKNFSFYNMDLLDLPSILPGHFSGADALFHFAANADVRGGVVYPKKDLYQNTLVTSNVLLLMQECGIKKIVFASTCALYGDTGETLSPIPETCPIPIQTSFYGASKLACEGLIQAYVAAYGFQAWIFRFGNIIGERCSHGVIPNFYDQLKKHPEFLHVVGGKEQEKTYLYVQDCVDGVLTGFSQTHQAVNIFNLGHTYTVTLPMLIPIITQTMGVNPKVEWSGNEVGWVGDSKISFLDIGRIQRMTDWKPTVTIADAVIKTVKWLQRNEWILDVRQ